MEAHPAYAQRNYWAAGTEVQIFRVRQALPPVVQWESFGCSARVECKESPSPGTLSSLRSLDKKPSRDHYKRLAEERRELPFSYRRAVTKQFSGRKIRGSTGHQVIERLGYRREPKRTLGHSSAAALRFSVISVTAGLVAAYDLGLEVGPPAFIWTWLRGRCPPRNRTTGCETAVLKALNVAVSRL